MAFQIGHPRYGGRKKGSLTKSAMQARLEELGIDLVKNFLEDLAEVDNPEKRCALRLSLMHFAFPKPQPESVEVVDEQQNYLRSLSDEKLQILYESAEDGQGSLP